MKGCHENANDWVAAKQYKLKKATHKNKDE